VREVSPQADPVTGAFRVRVGLDNPPEVMRLGSTVTGRMRLEREGGVTVPATALGRAEGRPAVWIFDPQSETVAPRAVEVLLHRPSEVVLSGGLAPGELVVTAGVQTLRPGQKVRLPGSV
jgi:RND family efflux transporter MFP subunit